MSTFQICDEIEQEVNKLWDASPGIGVKELMAKLQSLELTEEVTKQRVKAAKQAIPYKKKDDTPYTERSKDDSDNPILLSEAQIKFVDQKIQERQSVRASRRYKEADEITKGLTTMGIIIDDEFRTWKVGKKNIIDMNEKSEQHLSALSRGVPCSFCGRFFASKNLVFKHLRDVSTSCGNSIFATGQKLPEAPSSIRKQEKKEAFKAIRRKKTGKAIQHSDPAASLWFGDLPIPYTRLGGQYRRLRAVLREYLPRNVPQPWLKKVMRKAYRKDGDSHNQGEYMGYAIIVFRDSKEADYVKDVVNGKEIKSKVVFAASEEPPDLPDFIIKVKNVKNKDESIEEKNTVFTCGGQDPPMTDQLRPLSLPEMQQRCERVLLKLKAQGKAFETEDGDSSDDGIPKSEHDKMLERTVKLINISEPREEIHHKGRLVPEDIRMRLLSLLSNLRWPAANHRKGLTSERYLVLQTNVSNDRFYGDVREACRDLMQWADPEYYYSGIAVTKNFVASPHIDDRDQSYQYAISLGDFTNGGQLCVEGQRLVRNDNKETTEEFVNVVDTHNRIARVDGRHIHWVRSWEGGSRYSLIFYDTRLEAKRGTIYSGVDESFLSSVQEK